MIRRRSLSSRPLSVLTLLLLGGSMSLSSSMGCAELQGLDLSRILDVAAPLDQSTVAQGLKEALSVGARRTAETLSTSGAFSNDSRLRLKLPGELGKLAGVLRSVGFSGQVDALEDAMNRSAESAAANAAPVFASAISSMSIADAFSILGGENDAATQYLRERTSSQLQARFSPIAQSAMQEVGFYSIYKDLITRYRQIPFVKLPVVDLEDYVADQTLTALFGELAKEEARIRQDPAARTSALLRRVFSGATASRR